MTEPTDADREKAAEIAGWPAKNWTELRDAIAAALAAERAAAVADLRARVEAVAEELEGDARAAQGRADGMDRTVRHHAAERRHARVAHQAASALRAAVTDTAGDPA